MRKDQLVSWWIKRFAFLGDAVYPANHAGKMVYNVTELNALLRLLEQIPAEKLLVSHKQQLIQEKTSLQAKLKAIYRQRKPGEPWIVWEDPKMPDPFARKK